MLSTMELGPKCPHRLQNHLLGTSRLLGACDLTAKWECSMVPLSRVCDKLLLWPPGSAVDRWEAAGTIWRCLFSVSL